MNKRKKFVISSAVLLFGFVALHFLDNRFPFLVFYGLGIYALFLTTNIYTVAAIRSIALLRAARGVGFVLTLTTAFLLFDALLSLKTGIAITGLSIFFVSLLLYWQ